VQLEQPQAKPVLLRTSASMMMTAPAATAGDTAQLTASASPASPAVHRASVTAAAQHSTTSQLLEDMLATVNKFENLCCYCYMNDAMVRNHVAATCSTTNARRCIRCYDSKHTLKQCTLKLASISDRICWFCGLPNLAWGAMTHQGLSHFFVLQLDVYNQSTNPFNRPIHVRH
jgi:hypothetical protein